jgi:hypothetical protein
MLDFHHRVSETSYEIKGSAPLSVVESLCREIEIEAQDFIIISPGVDILAFYGDVFGYSGDGG